MTFPLFDLHCDTAFEMEKRGESLTENNLAVSLTHAKEISPYVQVMAFWTPQTLSDEAGWQAFLRVYHHFMDDPAVKAQRVRIGSYSASDGRPTLLFSIEDGRILAGDLSRLNTLHALGVRIFTPFWAGENILGGAHDTDKGLSPFGRESLQKALALGMIPDLSHASVASAREILSLAEAAERPVIASHSNAYDLCPASRNLHREELQRIISCGGLIGLNLHKPFLSADGDATLSDLLRQIDYFLEHGAEKNLALGGDLDGSTPIPEIQTVGDYQKLWERLLHEGFPTSIVNDLFFGNASRFAESYFR